MPTVLVADDDADHRELMTLALTRDGLDVVTAADAAVAYALVTGGGIDAALLDVRMPGESGIELCRRLRTEPRTALLPVLMISAAVGDDRILEALHAGADDFLTKPFHRVELSTRLGNLLLRRQAAPAEAAALAARHAVRTAPAGRVHRRIA